MTSSFMFCENIVITSRKITTSYITTEWSFTSVFTFMFVYVVMILCPKHTFWPITLKWLLSTVDSLVFSNFHITSSSECTS
jgi:hypothetical protein